MKKKFITFSVITCFALLLSFTASAQREAGGSAGDPTLTNPDLVINLGSAGVIEIPATSPYYAFVTSILSYFHVTIAPDGTVSFPTTSCYNTCVSTLFYTRCIDYSTYKYACKNPPSGCR